MTKLLHTADIHLVAPPSEDSDYSLECLKTLIHHAAEESVDGILLCGDIFDKESDYQNKEFFSKVIRICDSSTAPIYYIPGNHEDISGKFTKLRLLDWGIRVKLFADVDLIPINENLEIVAIPHAQSYENYLEWNLPPKKATHRIALAHGEIPGLTFLGDEDRAGVLNTMMFINYEISHVFLGHIHLKEAVKDSGIDFYFAGSPRVVRRSEIGERGYFLINIGSEIGVTRKALPEMGVMHRIESTVLTPEWEKDVEPILDSINKNDRVRLELEGVLEDTKLKEIDNKISKMKLKLQSKCRRVDIIKGYEPVTDFIQNPFYQKVYDEWLARKPKDLEGREYEVWIHSLNSLKFIRENIL